MRSGKRWGVVSFSVLVAGALAWALPTTGEAPAMGHEPGASPASFPSTHTPSVRRPPQRDGTVALVPAPGGGVLRGWVREWGEPVADVELSLLRAGSRIDVTRSAPDGSFTFRGFTGDAFTVRAIVPGAFAESEVRFEDGSGTEELALDLEPGTFIRGVIRARDGHGLPSIEVAWARSGGSCLVETRTRILPVPPGDDALPGTRTFELGPFRPGHHRLLFDAVGFAPATRTFEIDSGEPEPLLVELESQSGSRGRVIPVPGPRGFSRDAVVEVLQLDGHRDEAERLVTTASRPS